VGDAWRQSIKATVASYDEHHRLLRGVLERL
jgi:hypothetical protein